MEAPELGHLTKVDPRSVWLGEAQNFTPWLAEEENIGRLADEIGIELRLKGTEKSVGPFKADILRKDTVDDQWGPVEDQSSRTDHGHLGPLLTYAADLDTVTIMP